jgi:hypothetical protein
MKIGIFIADSNGRYPVPATKGGAVSTLVEHLVAENNKNKLVEMEIVSFYDKAAAEQAIKYSNISFRWIKSPAFVCLLDSVLFWIVRKFFKKKKAISYKSIFSLLYYILKAKKILSKANYDKVILENNAPLAWIIKLSKYKGQYFYHFHNVPRINAKCKEVFQGCESILCVSQYVANEIQKNDTPIGPISKEKIKILYNCIDTNLFHKITDENKLNDVRCRYGILPNQKVIVFVGRLSEEKGADKLLEAIKLLKDVDVKVLIVGSLIMSTNVVDAYQIRLHKLSEEMCDKVIFTGYISHNDLPVLYSIADVVVLPSMWDEPAGLTMIEALACGTQLITTNSGGIPEYVSNYAVALDRDNNLINNIAKQIEKAICSDVLSNKDATNYVGKKFSSYLYLENFVNLIFNERC